MKVRTAWRVSSPIAALAFVGLLSACSINQFAVRTVGGFLAGSGQSTVFTGDDDPELVGDALPFAMKTYESLLEADPGNAPLALATGKAFVSYAYAFVQTPASMLPTDQVDEQKAEYLRAKNLFLRGRGYILQGLETRRRGFSALLDKGDVAGALKLTRRDDADYLYWLGSAWLGAFSADPFDFSLIVAAPRAVSLLQQVSAWDESYGAGAVQEILISYYGGAPADMGGGEDKARGAFARAVALSKGLRVGPYLALATSVSVKNQNVDEFRQLLGKALAVDLAEDIPDRLANTIAQRKARWLLDHVDDFFLTEGGDS